MNLTQATTPTMPPAVLTQLRSVADDVARSIEGAAHVTVSVVGHDDTWASICTHPDAEALGEIELSTGGPALDALWSGGVARIPTTIHDSQWPEYSLACRRRGVRSVAAFPISINSTRVGVLTVASKDYCEFGHRETRIGMDAAARAAGILRDALDD
jgi:GAF domain-containing protein